MREREGFHLEAALRLTVMCLRKVQGKWAYPHSADVLAAAHLQPIVYYIQKRRHAVHNKYNSGSRRSHGNFGHTYQRGIFYSALDRLLSKRCCDRAIFDYVAFSRL